MGAPATRNWKAWENRQPPNPPGPTIHVVGEVETTNGAIAPVLEPTVPQGINPTILMLDRTLQDKGIGTDDVAYRPAKYEKDVSQGEHTQVQIMWDGESIKTIDVEIVR